MSILKFFKPLEKPLVTPSTNKALPDSKRLLTKVIVNDEVLKMKNDNSYPT